MEEAHLSLAEKISQGVCLDSLPYVDTEVCVDPRSNNITSLYYSFVGNENVPSTELLGRMADACC